MLRRWQAKYVAEWFCALLLLVGTLPLLVVLALAVKLTSRGPVLYVAERLGRGGRPFRLYKLRSMRSNVPQLLGPDGKVLCLENDARLTPIGKFLRLGFDELPQLFNVIRGDMCLIGPRPDVPWEAERYSPSQRARLEVLPGITGLAQVLDGRSLGNDDNYALDVHYVRCSSLRMDLTILLLTLPYALGFRNIGRRIFPNLLRQPAKARPHHTAGRDPKPELCSRKPRIS